MRLSVGTLLALITLIGAILIGGANFGAVRAIVEEQKLRINRLEEQYKNLNQYIRKNNTMLAGLAKDMEWMKREARLSIIRK